MSRNKAFFWVCVCLAICLVGCRGQASSKTGGEPVGGELHAGHGHEDVAPTGHEAHGHEVHGQGAEGGHDHVEAGPDGGEGEDGHRHEESQDPAAETVVDAEGIRWAPVGARKALERLQPTGEVVLNEERTFALTTRVEAQVGRFLTDVGDRVKAGQSLVELESLGMLERRRQWLEALQELDLAERAWERGRQLLRVDGVERRELEARNGRLVVARARVVALQEDLVLLGVPQEQLEQVQAGLKDAKMRDRTLEGFLTPRWALRAPAAGVVLSRGGYPGLSLAAGAVVLTLSDLDQPWALMDLPARLAGHQAAGGVWTVRVDELPGKTFEGVLDRPLRELNPQLRTQRVRLRLRGTGGQVLPGMFVRAELEQRDARPRLAVPPAAWVSLNGQTGVFIREHGTVAFLPLREEGRDAEGFVFAEGLRPDLSVAVEGTARLKGMELQRLGGVDPHAGHVH